MLLILPSALFMMLCSGSVMAEKPLVLPCDRSMFEAQLQMCLRHFNSSIEDLDLDFRSQCMWPRVKGAYHVLKLCVDSWAKASWCAGVSSIIDQFFLDVHGSFFRECGRVRDPSMSALLLMVAPLIVSTFFLPLLCVHLTTRGHH